MAVRIVLYTYKTEEKVEDSGSLRQWEEELCPYDFPTKEEKENAKMTKAQYDASVVKEEKNQWWEDLQDGDKVVWVGENLYWVKTGDILEINSLGEFFDRDGVVTFIEDWHDALAPYCEPHSYEGIYLSKRTGRLFELLQTDEDEFTLTYCDDGQPFLYNPISGWVFGMHLNVMEYYEPVFSYLEVERGMV
jgi:hypothetical protein